MVFETHPWHASDLVFETHEDNASDGKFETQQFNASDRSIETQRGIASDHVTETQRTIATSKQERRSHMEEEVKNKRYDGKSIDELENSIEQFRLLSRESQKEMYECLEYLRRSNRYKESPRYKTSSFERYLEDRFNIRMGTYRESVRAYLKFPEYTKQFGVGMVAKVDRLCGAMKVEKVMSEIQQEIKTHKTPLPRAKIETIIQRCRTAPKIKKDSTPWKAMYEREKASHDRTKEALRVAMAKIKEQAEQIERLKLTALQVSRIKRIFDERPALTA